MKNCKNTYVYVAAKMKMADVLAEHNNLILLLPRFGIPLGFGDKTIADVCADNNVPLPLFLLICNVYSQDEFIPETRDLMQFPVDALVQYLHASHLDYLNEIFPHIERHLTDVVVDWDERYKTLIINFFYEYKKEIVAHFQYEEQVVFPYISCLTQHTPCQSTYKISFFKKHHSNIEDKLSDFTNLLVKYIPADVSQRERVDMLSDIYALSDDIEKHTLIENNILVPYIQVLENDEYDEK